MALQIHKFNFGRSYVYYGTNPLFLLGTLTTIFIFKNDGGEKGGNKTTV